jgi:hypothetical protein
MDRGTNFEIFQNPGEANQALGRGQGRFAVLKHLQTFVASEAESGPN